MARLQSNTINNPDGSRLWTPPDAVFARETGLYSEVNLEAVSTTQLYSLGAQYSDVWGRVFRYVEYGGTIAKGSLVQAEGPAAAHDDLDLSADGAAGDLTISVASPASGTDDVITNEYAGGFVKIEKLARGYMLPIALNEDCDISEVENFVVTLWVPLRAALVADCDIALIKSPYKEVIIVPTTLTAIVVGVSMATGADNSYGWVQTRGPAQVLTAGTAVIGNMVVPLTTAGALAPAATSDVIGSVGRVMDVGPTTEWSAVWLTLE